jgi:hypothetical protein
MPEPGRPRWAALPEDFDLMGGDGNDPDIRLTAGWNRPHSGARRTRNMRPRDDRQGTAFPHLVAG